MDEINDEPGWSARLTVSGATLVEETESWGIFEEGAALFHLSSSGSALVRVVVTYSGPNMVPGTLEVNGQSDGTFENTVEIPIDHTYQSSHLGSGNITATVLKEHYNEETDETTYYRVRGDFSFRTYFFKALHVELVNSFGDYRRSVRSYKKTPYFHRAPNGTETIQFHSAPWGDVGVQVVTESPLFVTPSSWERTNEFGHSAFHFTARPSPGEFNEHGLWHANLQLRAVKDGYELETDSSVSLPFSVLKNAHNVWHLGPSGGIGEHPADPVSPPATLKPGDRMQVGSRISINGFMDVEFINGQRVRSEAAAYEGFIATIKNGDIAEGRALLWLDVKNVVQDIRDNPRRAARMLIYKAPGNALDTLLGVPEPVGWGLETPGGLVSKQLAEWGEQAYEPSPPPPDPSALRMEMRQEPLSAAAAESMTPPEELGLAAVAGAKVDIFTDGSVLIENRGDPLLLRDESGRVSVISSGASRITPGGNAQTVLPSAPLTSTEVWEAPLPGAWLISPSTGSTVTTSRPEISLANEQSNAINWSTAIIRLDGSDITAWLTAQLDFDFTVLGLNGVLPEALRLTDGEHNLQLTVNTQQGAQVVHSTTFTVAAGVNSNSHVEARAYKTGVWVSWEFEEDFAAFEVLRAPEPDGEYTALTAGSPRVQPGFFDQAPLPTNHYRIIALDTEGLPAATAAVAAEWSAEDPNASVPSEVAGFSIEHLGDALEVRFADSFPANTRWLLERSSDAGPFQALLPLEDTVRSGFLDQTVVPGSNVVYRLTPVSADGLIPGTPVTVTTSLPEEPSPPAGFTLSNTNSGVQLRWDAYADRRAVQLRVYRNTGEGFALLTTLGLGETQYTDPGAGSGPARYFLTSAGLGHESSATPSLGLATHPPASNATEIRIPESALLVKEGIATVTIPVERSGNLSEPAIAHFATAEGTARSDEDYVKTGGTLFFDPGQTHAIIEVEILPDAADEWSEYFYLDLHVYGDFGPSTVSPEGARIQVTLEESDYLFFEGYQTKKMAWESDETVNIVVERAVPSDRDISVEIIVKPETPGDSEPGVDWQDSRPWRVHFLPGETKTTLNLALINNASKDGTRTLNLLLDDPWGGGSAEGDHTELELTILDDDTRPGMLRPMANGQVHIAAAGTNSLDIALERAGGTDGSLSVDAMVFGGPLPWGAVSSQILPATLEAGETSATLRLQLNRTGLSDQLAPFGVVQMTSSEPPYENVSIPFVFFPNGDRQGFADFSAAAGFSSPGIIPDGDDDQDGEANLIEVAAFGDPLSVDLRSTRRTSFEFGQINWSVALRGSSQLAVFAQYNSQLGDTENTAWDAGWWEQSEDGWNAEFSGIPPQDNGSAFSRLIFIWVDDK